MLPLSYGRSFRVTLVVVASCNANECFVVADFVELLTSISSKVSAEKAVCLDRQQHIVVSEHKIEMFLGNASASTLHPVSIFVAGSCRRSSFAAVNV